MFIAAACCLAGQSVLSTFAALLPEFSVAELNYYFEVKIDPWLERVTQVWNQKVVELPYFKYLQVLLTNSCACL